MELVRDILNGAPDVEIQVLDFYEPYIKKMATEAYYDADGNRVGYRLNEDMAQEIRIELFKCVPKVRKATLKKYFDGEENAVFVLPDDVP